MAASIRRMVALGLLAAALAGMPAGARNPDRPGDKLKDQARKLYFATVRCTKRVLGGYELRTNSDGSLRVPVVRREGWFSAKDALACRDMESAALVFWELAQRAESKAALRDFLPVLEQRFRALPKVREREKVRERLEKLRARLAPPAPPRKRLPRPRRKDRPFGHS